MTKSLSPDQVRHLLNRGMQMSFSPVVVHLVQALLDPASDVRTISRILGMDPLLSADIMRLANTPYFGTASPVANLEQAAMLLGTREILRLALSVSIKKGLSKYSPLPEDKFFQAWRTIVWGAIVGQKLSAVSKAASPEMAYLTILLKDLALFLLYEGEDQAPWICPSEYAPEDDALELEHWGATHAGIGRRLVQSWKLPL